ncbi:MAG: elongation factor Ts [Chlamydiales bacterium]|nr:elongation factor Ts [Chlamydiia bacterium]MCP5507518.1 elongation factor Ts [Chlamydiales bacterium]
MATTISVDLIKKLRDRTGIGMGDCKKALEETGGDIEGAIDYLRKKGMASAAKKEERATNEGKIGFFETADTIGIVEVNAETDFVVQNDRFQEFVDQIAEEVAMTKPADLEAFMQQKFSKESGMTIDEYRATIIQTIGENIQIRRILVIPKTSDKSVGVYSHMGGKILTTVEISGASSEEELAKNIAMHVAAASPEFLSPDTVPAEAIAREKEIGREQVKGKPEHVMEKILEGKVAAFMKESCLTNQPYIRDDKLSVSQVVEQRAKEGGKALTITSFNRWSIGQ